MTVGRADKPKPNRTTNRKQKTYHYGNLDHSTWPPRACQAFHQRRKNRGGIFLPDTAKEKPQEAEVIALGIGKDDEGKDVKDLFTVKKGDKVLISKYGGTEVKLDGEDVLIINETDILGILA